MKPMSLNPNYTFVKKFARVIMLLGASVLLFNGSCLDFLKKKPVETSSLVVEPRSLDFGASETSKSIFISNKGSGELIWNVTAQSDWIEVSPTAGSATTETDQVIVRVNRDRVALGDHLGTITVSAKDEKQPISITMSKKLGDDDRNQRITSIINSGGEFEDPTTFERVDSTTTSELINDEYWVCTTKRYSITETPQDFPNFDPNAEVVFPGNLLQGKTLADATPEPIIVKRGPGTIVLTLVNGGTQASKTVQEVNIGNVFDAMNQIINQNPGALPARFFFTVEEVKSEKQLELELKANANILKKVKLDVALKFSQDRKYNRFLVQLNQSFFTMVYQLPLHISDVFAPEVTPTDLSRYVGPGNPPAYISSVTYGRIFYLLVESTSKKTEISGSINASLTSGIAGGEIKGKYINELENIRVKAYAIGGDAGSAIRAVTKDFEALKNFLAEGGNIRTGAPLSYNLRSVASNKVVKNKVATEYDVKDCIPLEETFGKPLIWFLAEDRAVQRSGDSVMTWMDASGHGSDARSLVGSSLPSYPRYISNAVNGLPAISFITGFGLPPSPIQPSIMRYFGGDFIGTNYTIFAVVKRIAFGSYFMSGADNASYRNLKVGFFDATTFVMSHQGAELRVSIHNAAFVTRLYTMRFSQTEGMAIYVDGNLAGSDPNQKQSLIDYPGASITSGFPISPPMTGFVIAEIKAYGVALSDEQRQAVEVKLKRKYKL